MAATEPRPTRGESTCPAFQPGDLCAACGEARRWHRPAADAVPVDWQAAASRAEAERDAAYRERAHLLAWLAALHPANAVVMAADDVPGEDSWQLLYLLAGGRQLSWHIHPRDTDLLTGVEHVDPSDPRAQWDGHTTAEKYQHIREHTALLNGSADQPVCLCTDDGRCPACRTTA